MWGSVKCLGEGKSHAERHLQSVWASFLHLPGQLVGQVTHTVPGRQELEQHLCVRGTGVALTWISAAQAAWAPYQIQSNLLTWQVRWDQLFCPVCPDKFRNPFLRGTLNAALLFIHSSFLDRKRPLQNARSCAWASFSVWLGKNLHVNWREHPRVLPKVAVHVQQPSGSALHVPLPPCSWWLAEGMISLGTHPHSPRKTAERRVSFYVDTPSLEHSCLCMIACMWELLGGFPSVFISLPSLAVLWIQGLRVPGAGSYQAALSSAEQYFFTLRRKSASLNICLTPWQLFDRTSTPLFTVAFSGKRHLYQGTLSFSNKALFPAGNRSSFPVSVHIWVLSPALSSARASFPKPEFGETAALRLVSRLQRLGSSRWDGKKERFFPLWLHQRMEVVE